MLSKSASGFGRQRPGGRPALNGDFKAAKDKAATRLQSVHRGKSGRILLEQNGVPERDEEQKAIIRKSPKGKKAKKRSVSPSAAATKLQRVARGKSGRNLLKTSGAPKRTAKEKQQIANSKLRKRGVSPTRAADAATRVQRIQRGKSGRLKVASRLEAAKSGVRVRCRCRSSVRINESESVRCRDRLQRVARGKSDRQLLKKGGVTGLRETKKEFTAGIRRRIRICVRARGRARLRSREAA